MAHSKGSLELFGGGHPRDITAHLTTLDGTDFLSIDTGLVRSGATSIRINKVAGASRGVRYTAMASRSAYSFTVAFRYVAATRVLTASKAYGFATFDPTISESGTLGFYNDAGNLKIAITDASGAAWRGSTTIAGDTWYLATLLVWSPTPGSANAAWKTQVILHDTSSPPVELDRSPIVQMFDNGLTKSAIANFGIGFWQAVAGGGYQNTELLDTIDMRVDTFALVSGGVFAPKDVKTAALMPDTEGALTAWDLAAGASKVNAVDPLADLDDTTYIISDDSADTTQSFTDSGGTGITLAGSEELFAVMVYARGRIVSGSGLITTLCSSGGVTDTAQSAGAKSGSTYGWARSFPYVRLPNASAASHYGGSGASPWPDVATADAVEFGCARTGGTSNTRRVTACLAEWLYGLPWNDTDPTGGATVRELDNTTSTRRAKNMLQGVT